MRNSGWLRVSAAVGIGLLLVVPSASGEPSAESADTEVKIVQGPSPADLVAYAYHNSPAIRAAREAWRAAVENYRVVTGYPDPQLMATYFPEPIETRLGPQDWNVTFTQSVPFPGKLGKAGEVAAAQARIARIKLDQTMRDVVVGLRESYWELHYIREAQKVAAGNLELVEHLRKVGETAYADNRVLLMDMVKAQAQLGQLHYDILLLRDLEQTESARMNSLLNRAPGALIGPLPEEGPPAPLNQSLEAIDVLAEAHQEEIRMARADVEMAGARTDLAQLENMPDFRVGLFWAAIGKPDVAVAPKDAGRDALGIQAGVTIPLWWGKNSGRLERARAEKRQAEAAVAARISETHGKIRAAYFKLQTARRLVELYREQLLPQAARAMEVAETWFREGEATFSDFVETEAVWYNFQLALARARADYGKSLAGLERLVGRSLVVQKADATGNARHEEAR